MQIFKGFSQTRWALLIALFLALLPLSAGAAEVPVQASLAVFDGDGQSVLIRDVPARVSVGHQAMEGYRVKALQADFDVEGIQIRSILPGSQLPEGYGIEWSLIDDSKLRIGILASADVAPDLPDGEMVRCVFVPEADGEISPAYFEIVDVLGQVLASGDFTAFDLTGEPVSGDFAVIDSVITVSGDSVDFEAGTRVGESAETTVTLFNAIDEALTVDLWLPEGPFSFDRTEGITVPASGTAALTCTFTPARAGNQRVEVSIQVLEGQLSGVVGGFSLGAVADPAPQAQLELTPSYVEFGTVVTEKTTVRTLTLSNVGDGPFTGTATVTGDGFTVSEANVALAAGESGAVEVSLNPAEGGYVSGKLQIEANDSGTCRNSVKAGLGGFALASVAAGTVVPEYVFMSSPDISSKDITLENIGTVPLTVKLRRFWAPYDEAFFDWEFQGAENDLDYVGSVDQGNTDTVHLSLNDYISSIRNHVARNSLLVILGNEDEGYQRSYTVMIRGLEDAAVPVFRPRGKGITYGSVLEGSRATEALLLANEGKKDMSYEVSLSGTGFAFVESDLSLSSADRTGTVTGGSSEAIQVAFSPSTTGQVEGTLTVVVTEEGGVNVWTRSYTLLARGTTSSFAICGYPSSVIIPSVAAGAEVPPSQAFNLRNEGTADGLTVKAAVLGDPAGHFILDQELEDGIVLDAGEERTFTVRLDSAESAQVLNALLQFTTNELVEPTIGPDSPMKDPFTVPLTAEILAVDADGAAAGYADSGAVGGLSGDETAGVKDDSDHLFGVGVDHGVISRDIRLVAPLAFDEAVRRMTVSADWGSSDMELPSGLWNVTLDCTAGEEVVFRAQVSSMPDDASWWKLTWNPDDYSTSFETMPELSEAVSEGTDDASIVSRDRALYPDAAHPGAGYFVRLGDNQVELHIVEGGIYDADKLRNGVLVDPGGVARLVEAEPVVQTPSTVLSADVGTLSADVTGTVTSEDVLGLFEEDDRDDVTPLQAKTVVLSLDQGATEGSIQVIFTNSPDGTTGHFVFARNGKTGAFERLGSEISGTVVRDASGVIVKRAGKMADTSLTVTLADGSDYDSDETTGRVSYTLAFATATNDVSPAAVTLAEPGSGGGCSLGFSASALLLLLPLLGLFGKRGLALFLGVLLLGACGSSALAADAVLTMPVSWQAGTTYELPLEVNVAEDENLTSFTADVEFRSDRIRARAGGLKISPTLAAKGWTLRASQMDLPGNVRRIRILLYGTEGASLPSGEVATLSASLLKPLGCVAGSSIGFAGKSVLAGDVEGNVVDLNSQTFQDDAVPVQSGGGCHVGALSPAAALFLLPVLVLRSKTR